MKIPRIGAHVVVPADQHAPDASHPDYGVRLHAHRRARPRRPASARWPLPPRSEVCGAPTGGAQVTALVIIIVCVQAQPLGRRRGRSRPIHGNLSNRLPPPLQVMPLSPRHREADGPPPPSVRTRRVAPASPSGRMLADLFLPRGGLGHRAIPREPFPVKPWQGLRGHQATLPPRQADASRRPLLEARGAARREPMSVSGRACHWQPVRRPKNMAIPRLAEPRHGADGTPGGVRGGRSGMMRAHTSSGRHQ